MDSHLRQYLDKTASNWTDKDFTEEGKQQILRKISRITSILDGTETMLLNEIEEEGNLGGLIMYLCDEYQKHYQITIKDAAFCFGIIQLMHSALFRLLQKDNG